MAQREYNSLKSHMSPLTTKQVRLELFAPFQISRLTMSLPSYVRSYGNWTRTPDSQLPIRMGAWSRAPLIHPNTFEYRICGGRFEIPNPVVLTKKRQLNPFFRALHSQ